MTKLKAFLSNKTPLLQAIPYSTLLWLCTRFPTQAGTLFDLPPPLFSLFAVPGQNTGFRGLLMFRLQVFRFLSNIFNPVYILRDNYRCKILSNSEIQQTFISKFRRQSQCDFRFMQPNIRKLQVIYLTRRRASCCGNIFIL